MLAARVIHANAIIIIQFASPRLREPDRGGGGDDVNLCVFGRPQQHTSGHLRMRALARAQIGNRTQKLRRRRKRKRIRLSDEQNQFENAGGPIQ